MKIKTYSALTEAEAIDKVKNDLGGTAIILNIKKIKPQGIFSVFRKQRVEVIAGYEENGQDKKKIEENLDTSNYQTRDMLLKYQEQEMKIQNIEKMLISTEELMENVFSKITVASKSNTETTNTKYENTILQLFYDELLKSDVSEEVAEYILNDIDTQMDSNQFELNRILKIVYNKIVDILKQPIPVLSGSVKNPAVTVFIGPTGVGKTTTIAKLASQLILNDNKSVCLITADTYRIAAVEQIKTYAEILNVPIEVVYSPEEIEISYNKLKDICEIILVDTAGRSHKNIENLRELCSLMERLPESQKFLVLSATTKYNDLLKIAEVFNELGDYNLVFTKLDETTSLGSILNICFKTGKGLSYITDGQNVPDDMKIAKPELIAKAILGSFDE